MELSLVGESFESRKQDYSLFALEYSWVGWWAYSFKFDDWFRKVLTILYVLHLDPIFLLCDVSQFKSSDWLSPWQRVYQ